MQNVQKLSLKDASMLILSKNNVESRVF